MSQALQNDGRGPFFLKDPRARLDVEFDWALWLTQENTTLESSVWEAAPGLSTDTPTTSQSKSRIYVSGGVAGQTYLLRNTVTTANGLIDSRSVRVVVQDR